MFTAAKLGRGGDKDDGDWRGYGGDIEAQYEFQVSETILPPPILLDQLLDWNWLFLILGMH